MDVHDLVSGQTAVGLMSLMDRISSLQATDSKVDELFDGDSRLQECFSLTYGTSFLPIMQHCEVLEAAVQRSSSSSIPGHLAHKQMWAEAMRYLTIAPAAYLRTILVQMQRHGEALVNHDLMIMSWPISTKRVGSTSWSMSGRTWICSSPIT